ncbi:Type 1 glutamine amidotransferase-like domain-containing protein [Nocardioides acrostichi]|uniref:Type 1 glutamine amidotransferase-like domain-containing protein n=1 Tax=Nocardioides acrostichi TaxID=2784339 RepID=A0A930Y735_9ACTN|nr:Type 1 glutamine amidotransferase-like domain-containing protein [Nocardioides acrostichi]MBF4161586.1 Type 1 glutamine amidotransferase-like domain-containing protein [Nocardioides acrostichi]
MKLLLTSGGVTTPSIRTALADLLGKPIDQARALCIPTGTYGHPFCDPGTAFRFVTGTSTTLTQLGWASVGLLELTALPSIGAERWMPWVREADVLLVDGGDATYLTHWLRESRLADLLPELHDTVWVGLSAGSMALTPRVGSDFAHWSDDDRGLGLVDFSVFPHLDVFPSNTLETAHGWRAEVGVPGYVLDDASALTVVDGRVEVVSDGQWHLLD